jgi:tetratricopeptide (TPR) repeat protein
MHFEQGRDYRRAIKYLRQAADVDSRRYAGREAIENLDHTLRLVERLPESEHEAARMAVLEQRGLVRRAMGDMTKAADDFIELACLAHECDQVETEAKALLHAASAFSWVDRQRCPETFERAVALIPRLQDELLKAHVLAYWGYWHSRFLTWRGEDEQACEKAIEAAKQAGDRALLSMHVARRVYYLCLRSDYESACRVAEEGSWLTLEAGDGFDYLYCLFYWAWALLHAGKWGKLRAVLRTATDLAERNGQNLLAALFNLETAWLHQQAFDFRGARDLCERILSPTTAGKHETGNALGLILQGTAHVGLGRYDSALECFNELAYRLEHDQVLMEWMFRLPLQYGLSLCLLGQGELVRARQEAETLCELASLPGERTYVALGRQMLAEVALAGGDWNRADREITHALDSLKGAEVPLAEWRVYATLATVCETTGRPDEAAQHRTKSAYLRRQLADSLDESDELRTSLLNAAGPAPDLAGRD